MQRALFPSSSHYSNLRLPCNNIDQWWFDCTKDTAIDQIIFDLKGIRQFPTRRTKPSMPNELIDDLMPASIDKPFARLGPLRDGKILASLFV